MLARWRDADILLGHEARQRGPDSPVPVVAVELPMRCDEMMAQQLGSEHVACMIAGAKVTCGHEKVSLTATRAPRFGLFLHPTAATFGT